MFERISRFLEQARLAGQIGIIDMWLASRKNNQQKDATMTAYALGEITNLQAPPPAKPADDRVKIKGDVPDSWRAPAMVDGKMNPDLAAGIAAFQNKQDLIKQIGVKGFGNIELAELRDIAQKEGVDTSQFGAKDWQNYILERKATGIQQGKIGLS